MQLDVATVQGFVESKKRHLVQLTLTPGVAEYLLSINTHNRRKTKLGVGKYTLDMAAGRWPYTGDTIKVTTDGKIADGQHRLTAYLQVCEDNPGFTLDVALATGIEPAAQNNMDIQIPRSVGNALDLSGVTHGNSVAAAANQYIRMVDRRMFKGAHDAESRLSRPEITEWVLGNLWFAELVANINGGSGTPFSPRYAAACYAHFATLDKDAADEFWEKLKTGANLSVGDPILTLRERALRNSKEKTVLSDRETLAMFIQAWNAFRNGSTVTRLQRPRNTGWTAKNFPTAI